MYVLGSKEPCRECGRGWLIQMVATGPGVKERERDKVRLIVWQ